MPCEELVVAVATPLMNAVRLVVVVVRVVEKKLSHARGSAAEGVKRVGVVLSLQIRAPVGTAKTKQGR